MTTVLTQPDQRRPFSDMTDPSPKMRPRTRSARRPAKLPDVFRVLDYRAWLREAVDANFADDPALSLRALSARCGFRSTGGLSLVLSARRNLTPDTARRVGAGLGLTVREQEHLALLVAWDRADDPVERSELFARLRAARSFAEVFEGSLHTYDFYRSWWLPILRELVALDDFEENADWIAERVWPRIAPAEITRGIRRLEELGFLVRDDAGRLRQHQPIVATEHEVVSDALVQHQRDMMSLAADALLVQPAELRDMRVMTMAISASQAERIKARLEAVHREILGIVSDDEPIEVVYQLNTQFFALSRQDATEPSP
jgi:uncharacterized protein (TIGR02147 family)